VRNPVRKLEDGVQISVHYGRKELSYDGGHDLSMRCRRDRHENSAESTLCDRKQKRTTGSALENVGNVVTRICWTRMHGCR
jgi:hypothetical protein